MKELIQVVNSRIKKNQSTLESLYDLYEDGVEPSETDPNVVEEWYTEYDDVDLEISLRVYYTGDPHKFDIDKGHFSFRLQINMEDTDVLTDLKDHMYDVSEDLFENRQHIVNQDYPRKEVWFDYELDSKEFESLLVN